MSEQQIRKRLFRLWIVVSVFWVCFSINEFAPYAFDLLEAFCVIFLPPVILLILGRSIFCKHAEAETAHEEARLQADDKYADADD